MSKLLKKGMVIAMMGIISAGGLAAVTFNDLASGLNDTYTVKSAEMQLDSAGKNIEVLKNPGDWAVSLNPGIKVTDKTEITGSLTVKVPLGLSSTEKEKLNVSMDAYTIAAVSVDAAKRKSFSTLYSLYQTAWLLQEEDRVLTAELEAANTKAAVIESQYKNGSVSLTDLTAAQNDLQTRKITSSQELMKQRISWYELSFTVNRAIREDVLERYELPMAELPTPPELSLSAYDNDPDIKAQQLKIAELRQTIARLKTANISLSIKPFAEMGDHSVSMEYVISDPAISASYAYDTSQGGTAGSTWSGGVTFGLSYTGGKSDAQNVSLLEMTVEQETARLDYMHDLLSLQIRTVYQQYLKAVDLLGQAKKDLERSMDNKNIVETKASIGQAAEYEQMEAQAAVLRAQWKVESARIDVEKAYLDTAVTASWEN